MEENKETAPAVDTPATPESERLSEREMMDLERARLNCDLAIARAEKAQADTEIAKLQYKNLVMQIFTAHKMSAVDVIETDGTIKRAQ